MDIAMDGYVGPRIHWFALSTALNYGGKIVCLSFFHNQTMWKGFPHEPRKLYQALMRQRTLLESLYKQGALSDDEWKLLFPENQETHSSKFEMGTLIALLFHLVLPPPVQDWQKNKKNSHDTRASFSLLKLREYIDKIAGWQEPKKLTFEKFHFERKALCDILFELGFNLSHLNPIWEASANNRFEFRREYKKQYHRALKDAKIMFFRKALFDLRRYYTKHLDNIVTVMSVVGFRRLQSLQDTALDLKHPLGELEKEFEILVYNRYKFPLKYLKKCDILWGQLMRNDIALDVEIERYNQSVDHESKKVRKKTFDDDKKKRKGLEKVSQSMKRASIVGWLRRNTLRNVTQQQSRTSILPNGKSDIFRNGVHVGDY